MSKREDYKIIEIGGRKFKIEKFTAEVGSYVCYVILEKVLPGGIESKLGLGNLPQDRKPLSRQEFTELQRDCLGVCYEVLPAGARPVIGENGQFGVEGLERNTKLVMALTIHALMFNILSFFDVEELKDLMTSLSTTYQLNALMSMNTPTPQS